MSSQGGLVQKSIPSTNEVLQPGSDQSQLHRDRSPSGQGRYYGRLKDGTEELIGGPGIPPGLVLAESGNFTISSDGTSATINGVDAGANWVNDGSFGGTLTIHTTKRFTLGNFLTSYVGGGGDVHGSQGDSDGVLESCISSRDGAAVVMDYVNVIHLVDGGGDGHTGKVANITANSFDIIFTPVGSHGHATTGQWHAITE